MSDFTPVTKTDWIAASLFLAAVIMAVFLVDVVEFFAKLKRRNAWKKAAGRLCFSPLIERSTIVLKRGDIMKFTLSIVALIAATILFVGCGETNNYYGASSSSVSTAASQSASEQSSSSSDISVSSTASSSLGASSGAASSAAPCSTAGVKMQSGVIKDIDAPLFGFGTYQIFATTYTGLTNGWTDFGGVPLNENATIHVVTPVRVTGEHYVIEQYRDKDGVYDLNDSEFTMTLHQDSLIYMGVKMRDCNSSIRIESEQLSGVAFAPKQE